jgi:hypothetical protein
MTGHLNLSIVITYGTEAVVGARHKEMNLNPQRVVQASPDQGRIGQLRPDRRRKRLTWFFAQRIDLTCVVQGDTL